MRNSAPERVRRPAVEPGSRGIVGVDAEAFCGTLGHRLRLNGGAVGSELPQGHEDIGGNRGFSLLEPCSPTSIVLFVLVSLGVIGLLDNILSRTRRQQHENPARPGDEPRGSDGDGI